METLPIPNCDVVLSIKRSTGIYRRTIGLIESHLNVRLRIRDIDYVLRPVVQLDGQRLVAGERLEARELPVALDLLHSHKLGITEGDLLHVGHVHVDLQDLEQLGKQDLALAGDAVGEAVIREVDRVAERVHGEAVDRHLDEVVALGGRVHGLDRNLALGLGQVRNLDLGGLLGTKLVDQLVVLELEAHLDGSLGGLHLGLVAVLVGRHKGHVVQKGVVVVVGVVAVDGSVHSVDIRTGIADRIDDKRNARRKHGGIGKLGGHADVEALIYKDLLRVGLGGLLFALGGFLFGLGSVLGRSLGGVGLCLGIVCLLGLVCCGLLGGSDFGLGGGFLNRLLVCRGSFLLVCHNLLVGLGHVLLFHHLRRRLLVDHRLHHGLLLGRRCGLHRLLHHGLGLDHGLWLVYVRQPDLGVPILLDQHGGVLHRGGSQIKVVALDGHGVIEHLGNRVVPLGQVPHVQLAGLRHQELHRIGHDEVLVGLLDVVRPQDGGPLSLVGEVQTLAVLHCHGIRLGLKSWLVHHQLQVDLRVAVSHGILHVRCDVFGLHRLGLVRLGRIVGRIHLLHRIGGIGIRVLCGSGILNLRSALLLWRLDHRVRRAAALQARSSRIACLTRLVRLRGHNLVARPRNTLAG